MTQTTETMKPVLSLVESSASSIRPMQQSGGLKSESVESNQSLIPSDRVIAHVWKRMISIYGHKWTSHIGIGVDESGLLSDSAITWQKGLAGITTDQIKHGFDVLIFRNHEWPPSLPEFRKICLSAERDNIPSIEQVATMLACVPNRGGSLVSRYQHPLVLAISAQIDMFALRTAKTVDAVKMVKPIYEKLLDTGWDGWPDHAYQEQAAIGREVSRSSKITALSALIGIKARLCSYPQ
jgi:hypothetical protein